jgi:hypothetical protein
MRPLIPTPEIIDDLLAENWELRWRVFESFYRARLLLKDFSRSSQEYKQARGLCLGMARRLNGASDVNLHLVLAAAWLLGDNHFLLLALENLGVDDPERDNPITRSVKRPLHGNHPEASFFACFKSLIERGIAIDAAGRTAVRIFPPESALELVASIPESEARNEALVRLREEHPAFYANSRLLHGEGKSRLQQQPELLTFIGPPLEEEEKKFLEPLLADWLRTAAEPATSWALRALRRLELDPGPLQSQLAALADHPELLALQAQRGNREAQERLLKEARAWRRGKRLAALERLVGARQPEIIALFSERLQKGSPEEQQLSRAGLVAAGTREAVAALLERATECRNPQEQKVVLAALAQTQVARPELRPADYSARLAALAEQNELYPELAQALENTPPGPAWEEKLTGLKSPVIEPARQEIAVLLAGAANRPQIREQLSRLLRDLDWGFSYRLLNRLAPHFGAREIPLLLQLLAEREERRELTVKERLTKGRDLEQLPEALAEFFLQRPDIAARMVRRLVVEIIAGRPPQPQRLLEELKQQPPALAALVLGGEPDKIGPAGASLPRMLAWKMLSAIEVDGSDVFALVVHRTRHYGGFFRMRISEVIGRIIENDPELQNPDGLPLLEKIIDFIRGQPEHQALREKLLDRRQQVIRRCRELQVFSEASQTRDLQVFKIRKLG